MSAGAAGGGWWSSSAAGGAFQATSALIGAGLNAWQSSERNKVLRNQLNEVKEQNKILNKRYEDTLKNQGEAINTLGQSFGKALEKQTSTKSTQKPQEPQKEDELLPTQRM